VAVWGSAPARMVEKSLLLPKLTPFPRWWINTLFACHAGIIDIETIDGGICHDKYGAYAVVIIEGGELDSPTESTLTYRCGKDDRGKFLLTAATPRSREPLRVLRSHSVNSMWGPKAGVRYEGLSVCCILEQSRLTKAQVPRNWMDSSSTQNTCLQCWTEDPTWRYVF
jgi:hypothetical protein